MQFRKSQSELKSLNEKYEELKQKSIEQSQKLIQSDSIQQKQSLEIDKLKKEKSRDAAMLREYERSKAEDINPLRSNANEVTISELVESNKAAEDFKTSKSTLQLEKEGLEVKVKELETTISDFKRKLESAYQTSLRLEESKTKENELNLLLEDKLTSIEELNQEIEQLKINQKELAASIYEKSITNEKLDRDLNEAKELVQHLTVSLNVRESSIRDYEVEKATATSIAQITIEGLKFELAVAKEQRVALDSQYNELEKHSKIEIANLKEKIKLAAEEKERSGQELSR